MDREQRQEVRRKPVKVGVWQGDGPPPGYEFTVLILSSAFDDSSRLLNMAVLVDDRQERASKMRRVLNDVMEMVRAHPEEDKVLFERLFLAAVRAENQEEREDAIVTMAEILSDGPQGNVHVLEWDLGNAVSTEPPQSENLRKWTEHVGGRVRALREKQGMTQEDLAIKASLTQSHISRIEKGVHSPSFKTLSKIAAVLGVSVGQIDPVMAD